MQQYANNLDVQVNLDLTPGVTAAFSLPRLPAAQHFMLSEASLCRNIRASLDGFHQTVSDERATRVTGQLRRHPFSWLPLITAPLYVRAYGFACFFVGGGGRTA